MAKHPGFTITRTHQPRLSIEISNIAGDRVRLTAADSQNRDTLATVLNIRLAKFDVLQKEGD